MPTSSATDLYPSPCVPPQQESAARAQVRRDGSPGLRPRSRRARTTSWARIACSICRPSLGSCCVYVARCTSFTHCLSSVASENFVSKLLKILSKGGVNLTRGGQFRMQLGVAFAMTEEVRCFVIEWMVRSDSLRAAPLQLPLAFDLRCTTLPRGATNPTLIVVS